MDYLGNCIMENHVLIIAYGNPIHYSQANFLILSLLSMRQSSDFDIFLYTDNINWIPDCIIEKIKINRLTSNRINNLKGVQNFNHRIKIALIEELCKGVEGNLLFIDADCLVTSNFKYLFEVINRGGIFMHKKEFSFEEARNIQDDSIKNIMHKLSSRNDYFDPLKSKYELYKLNYSMWNSGVIGISIKELIPLFEDLYGLTHYFYGLSELHTSEQLAFSIILQKKGKLSEAAPYIYHYWDSSEKEFVNEYLRKTLNKLNYDYSEKGYTSKRIHFDNFQNKTERSYIVKRNLSIEAFQNNSFTKGYLIFLKAFIKNPLLDHLYKKELNYHFKRHSKHLFKEFLKKFCIQRLFHKSLFVV